MIEIPKIFSAKEESLLHVQDYLQMLRTRWRIVVFVFLIVFTSSAIITRIMTPHYSSRMQFEIILPSEIVTPAQGAENPITASMDRSYMQTQFELLISQRNLAAIAKKLDLASEWGLSEALLLKRLGRMIDVNPLRGTNLVDVSVSSPDPRLSQRICRAVADCYEEVRQEKEAELIQSAISGRFEVLRSRQEELENKADAVRQYIRSGKYLTPGVWEAGNSVPQDGNMVQLAVNECNERKNLLSAEISSMEVHIAELQKLKDDDMLSYVTSAGLLTAESYSSQKVRALSEQLKEEELERSKMLLSGYAELHPHVKIADKQIATTKAQLYVELEGLRKAMLSQLGLRQAELEAVEEELKQAKEELKSKMLEDQKMEMAVQAYMAEKERYDQLENEYIADKIRLLTPRSIIDISSQPDLAQLPSSPNHALNLALGAIVGLIAGIGVAFLSHYFDTSIKSLEEAERQLGVPVLGVIPRNITILGLQEGVAPDAEAYRILRTNIELKSKLCQSKIFAITSANAGDGKTTTLSNLGYIFAQGGKRTLMIDADMRRPRLAAYNELTAEQGLSHYLSQDMDLKDLLIELPQPHLSMLPAGISPSDPAGLLNSPRMEKLLQQASAQFDIILIDAAPILGVSDAAIIVSKVDATLFVMQPRKAPLKTLQRALMNIKNAEGNIMGLVMNKVDIRDDTTYQYYTNYYEYYYSEEAQSNPNPTPKKRNITPKAEESKETKETKEKEALY